MLSSRLFGPQWTPFAVHLARQPEECWTHRSKVTAFLSNSCNTKNSSSTSYCYTSHCCCALRTALLRTCTSIIFGYWFATKLLLYNEWVRWFSFGRAFPTYPSYPCKKDRSSCCCCSAEEPTTALCGFAVATLKSTNKMKHRQNILPSSKQASTHAKQQQFVATRAVDALVRSTALHLRSTGVIRIHWPKRNGTTAAVCNKITADDTRTIEAVENNSKIDTAVVEQ